MTRTSFSASTPSVRPHVAGLMTGLLALATTSCGPASGGSVSTSAQVDPETTTTGSPTLEAQTIRREVRVRTSAGYANREVAYRADELILIVPDGALSLGNARTRRADQALITSPELRDELEGRLGAREIRRLGRRDGALDNVFLVRGIDVDPYDYAADPGGGILKAEPNYVLRVGQSGKVSQSKGQVLGTASNPSYPGDALFPQQWSLDNQGQTGGTADADIDVLDAWAYEQGDPDVVIAIIDTGVDYTHRDLRRRMWDQRGGDPGQRPGRRRQRLRG